MKNEVIFATADIHGEFEQLVDLVSACRKLALSARPKFIFLGDYIDRGPSSKKVVDFLINLQVEDPENVLVLKGNHEEMCLNASRPDRSDRELMTWYQNGGEATLGAYKIDDPIEMPAEHLAWFRDLPLHHQDAHRLFVHAGIDPGIPLAEQKPETLMWIREPFLSSEADHGKLVVHGHTPTASRLPELKPNRLNLDVGACFGGRLMAAVFVVDQRFPTYFISCDGKILTVTRPEVGGPRCVKCFGVSKKVDSSRVPLSDESSAAFS